MKILTQARNVARYVPALFANRNNRNNRKSSNLWKKRGDGVQGWEELLDALLVDSTTVQNTVSETIACPDFNIPRFYLAPGRVLRYQLFGNLANIATTPGNVTFRVRWGGVGGVLLGATAALSLDTTVHTYSNWVWEGALSCRSTGATGTIIHHGMITLSNRLSTDAIPSIFSSSGGAQAANAAVQVDTTTDKLLSFTVQFNTGNAGNNCTTQQRLIEALN